MGSVKCIMALSARIGLRITLLVFLRSIMTVSAGALASLLTWRTQTYLSDSSVYACQQIRGDWGVCVDHIHSFAMISTPAGACVSF